MGALRDWITMERAQLVEDLIATRPECMATMATMAQQQGRIHMCDVLLNILNSAPTGDAGVDNRN